MQSGLGGGPEQAELAEGLGRGKLWALRDITEKLNFPPGMVLMKEEHQWDTGSCDTVHREMNVWAVEETGHVRSEGRSD